MKIAAIISRYLLGLIFLFFGLNGFLNFMQGQMPPGTGAQFVAVLASSGYVYAVAFVSSVSAILFLINRYVPLALVLIGPVIVNILLFHILMMPATIAPGLLVTVAWFILFWSVRSAFTGIFQARVTAG